MPDKKLEWLRDHWDEVPRENKVRLLDGWAIDNGYTTLTGEDIVWIEENLTEENAKTNN